MVGEARRRLPGVSVVEVTAPPDVLAARLAARGRREDGDLGARLARSASVVADLVVVNDGAPEAGAARLVAHHLRAR